MRKAVAVGIIGFSILAGCSAGYDAAMQIKNNQTEELLMGTFDGSIALIHGSTKEASISVTDGRLSCEGISMTGKFSTDMSKNKVRHTFKVSCNDGRTGVVVASITARPDGYGARVNGTGIGSLSDGSKVRVVFGEMTGALSW